MGWLDFVVTARARTRIKSALKEGQKSIAEEGKEILTRKLRHLQFECTQGNQGLAKHRFYVKVFFVIFKQE